MSGRPSERGVHEKRTRTEGARTEGARTEGARSEDEDGKFSHRNQDASASSVVSAAGQFGFGLVEGQSGSP